MSSLTNIPTGIEALARIISCSLAMIGGQRYHTQFLIYTKNQSDRVLCNANSSEGFNASKDATLPEINLRTGAIKGFIGGPSSSKRPYLGFFAGGVKTAVGPLPPLLLKHWKGVDQDLCIYEYQPKELSYYDMMRKSKFCICPSGYEVASPRIVEAMYSECVPVIISDHYVLVHSSPIRRRAQLEVLFSPNSGWRHPKAQEYLDLCISESETVYKCIGGSSKCKGILW